MMIVIKISIIMKLYSKQLLMARIISCNAKIIQFGYITCKRIWLFKNEVMILWINYVTL